MDSGASWSIVGTPWLMRWSGCKSKEEWHPVISASRRRFRFGDHQLNKSLGSVLINAGVKDNASKYHTAVLEVDIVLADAPLLISRASLSKMVDVVGFRHLNLTLASKIVAPLQITPGGHIAMQLFQRKPCLLKSSTTEIIFMADDLAGEETDIQVSDHRDAEMSGRLLTAQEILKIHRQLGHATVFALRRLIKLAK